MTDRKPNPVMIETYIAASACRRLQSNEADFQIIISNRKAFEMNFLKE
jgi:hypothetical protein